MVFTGPESGMGGRESGVGKQLDQHEAQHPSGGL